MDDSEKKKSNMVVGNNYCCAIIAQRFVEMINSRSATDLIASSPKEYFL